MKSDDLESQGLIERVEPNLGNVKKALERAQRDLRTARATLGIDEEWAYTIAYHAMLRAGRALMAFLEYRPKGKDQHRTVGKFCSRVLGEDYRTLINKFHRMKAALPGIVISSILCPLAPPAMRGFRDTSRSN
jgi:hypothetical protein